MAQALVVGQLWLGFVAWGAGGKSGAGLADGVWVSWKYGFEGTCGCVFYSGGRPALLLVDE